jgi:hypothetical protein
MGYEFRAELSQNMPGVALQAMPFPVKGSRRRAATGILVPEQPVQKEGYGQK